MLQTMINDDSITLRKLTAIKQDRMLACEALQRRLRKTVPIYDLCTSLELQSVELPAEMVLNKAHCHVAVRDVADRRRLSGVVFHRYRQPFSAVVVARRFQCVAVIDVWMHYARFLSVEGLVILLDNMTRRDRHLRRTTMEEVRRELERAGSFPGRRKCIQALRLAREHTDSSWETKGRLALMRYGLPCPSVNYPVPVGSRKILLDMAYPEWKIGIEYDGGHHAMQWKEDNKRREKLERQGWRIVKVFVEDLVSEVAEENLAVRVADAIAQVAGKSYPLTSRQTLERLSDGRRWRYGTLQCWIPSSGRDREDDLSEYDRAMEVEAAGQLMAGEPE